jgi:hypothetical protein
MMIAVIMESMKMIAMIGVILIQINPWKVLVLLHIVPWVEHVHVLNRSMDLVVRKQEEVPMHPREKWLCQVI